MLLVNKLNTRIYLGLLILTSLLSVNVLAQVKQAKFSIVTAKVPNDTIGLAIQDLQHYLLKSVPGSKIHLSNAGDATFLQGTVIVLMDHKDEALRRLAKSYGLSEDLKQWNSFKISTFKQKKKPSQLIYFLQGADAMGSQYAIYELMERLLGVRYLLPDYDQIPVHSNFKPTVINTGIEKPDYKWRGLYPWNYNYNGRGLTTFCDLNAHFVSKDWAWYRMLGNWMIKNKQNAFLWFDDVFSYENISGQFPDELSHYYASRGIKQILGVAFGSNEGSPRGGEWEDKICLDPQGKSVEKRSFEISICPQVPEYKELAEKNFSNMKLNAAGNYLGVLIGYGENSWAAREAGNNCVRHPHTPSSSLMIRDLNYVSSHFKNIGMGNLPVGFVSSTHSSHPGNPFETDSLIDHLPKNAIFSMHTYQQASWKNFKGLYDKIDQRNQSEHTSIKAFHIGEVAFLCGTDIPLLKPSVLRRRSEHFNTLPKKNTLGHLATLNTTQYLYWYSTYQMLKWQWHKDEKTWNQSNLENFTGFFGIENGQKLNDIFNRLTCLEYVLPYSELDWLIKTNPDLRPPSQWSRYNEKTHPQHYGFLLWADVKEIDRLLDAETSIDHIYRLNEQLNRSADQKYKTQFYATIRLTAHYYTIRVESGKYEYYLKTAKEIQKNKGWNAEVEKNLLLARVASEKAHLNLVQYNEQLVPLLGLTEKNKKANTADLATDFVHNPKEEYFTAQIAVVETALRTHVL